MIEKSGNIFDSDAYALAHGVNIYGKMGAGIAKQFKERHPDMFNEYEEVCLKGELSPGGVFVYRYSDLVIYNVASQSKPGAYARLEWLESSLSSTVEHAWSLGIDLIAIPQIGCGIGGLILADVIPVLLDIEDHSGVEFELWTYAP